MKLTGQDRKAMEMTCNCIRNCKVYQLPPAPYFPLLVRMFKELETAGMIQWEGVEPLEVPPYQ